MLNKIKRIAGQFVPASLLGTALLAATGCGEEYLYGYGGWGDGSSSYYNWYTGISTAHDGSTGCNYYMDSDVSWASPGC